jgi:hypothetical protein
VHVLFLATLRGLCVRGPVVGREQAFVLVRDWLPRAKRVDRDKALRELGRRYLAAHAESTDRDLAKWAGITLTDAGQALTDVKAPKREPAPLPPPTLLGPFEEILMGWESRDLVLGTNQGVVTKNGIFYPIALSRGKAVATWSMPKDTLVLDPFKPIPTTVERALQRDARDVQRFLAG